LELAEKAALPVVTAKADLAALLDSDEIFLTSSGLGIAGVARIGEREFAHETSDYLKLLFDVELKA
jgi:branched-subunit amino acid aminotransferase/4-amino-4-deoxychorismate lyase